MRTTFPAGFPVSYLGRRVQNEGLEGPSIAATARRERDENGSKCSAQPVERHGVDGSYQLSPLRQSQGGWERSLPARMPGVSIARGQTG